jgi:hypothetical protein
VTELSFDRLRAVLEEACAKEGCPAAAPTVLATQPTCSVSTFPQGVETLNGLPYKLSGWGSAAK